MYTQGNEKILTKFIYHCSWCSPLGFWWRSSYEWLHAATWNLISYFVRSNLAVIIYKMNFLKRWAISLFRNVLGHKSEIKRWYCPFSRPKNVFRTFFILLNCKYLCYFSLMIRVYGILQYNFLLSKSLSKEKFPIPCFQKA